ncbi:uncharacterized protein [Fopius arisanus]|uniref:Uncharacterized protein n=1 Tax=Fopius arisanus TaxID=64838 RepID=A0A9R1TS42_9HYME|nr:PREDICTED: uncharacterized protein LOC105273487 [Fopius arisanus]
MPVLEGGVAKKRTSERIHKMRMRFSTTSKESYTLLSKKRKQQLAQSIFNETESKSQSTESSESTVEASDDDPEAVKNTTQDLFELLAKVQSSRLDDQRCVLPAYNCNQCGQEMER